MSTAKRTADGIRESITHFQRAIALDSTYAPAYAGLADAYLLSSTHYLMTPARAGKLATASAQRALALDPRLGQAYAALGFARLFDEWNWTGAGQAFDRAVALPPKVRPCPNRLFVSTISSSSMPAAGSRPSAPSTS